MLIDWFTVGAQVINFVVLLWLMKRYLYGPLLTAIDAREKRIADELAEAARQTREAAAVSQALAARRLAFDGEQTTLRAAALVVANREHDRLLAASHAAAETWRVEQESLWHAQEASQTDELCRSVTTEVFAIARRALDDLAGAELEGRMVARIIARMRELPADGKAAWTAAFKEAKEAAVVRSRFSLVLPLRAQVQTEVSTLFGSDVPLCFEQGSDSVCGIEMMLQGRRIAWTIADYLQALHDKVDTLAKTSQSAPAARTAPVAPGGPVAEAPQPATPPTPPPYAVAS